jgi:hypothetical protein
VVLAEHNACSVVIVGRKVQLVGSTEEVAVVRAMFGWLVAEIGRLLRASGIRGRDARSAFRFGAIEAVDERLRSVARVRASGRERALVRMATVAAKTRALEAEAIVDGVAEGVLEVGRDEVDAAGFVAGLVMGRGLDPTGFQGRVTAVR